MFFFYCVSILKYPKHYAHENQLNILRITIVLPFRIIQHGTNWFPYFDNLTPKHSQLHNRLNHSINPTPKYSHPSHNNEHVMVDFAAEHFIFIRDKYIIDIKAHKLA